MVARFVRDEEAVGSNPATPTTGKQPLTFTESRRLFSFFRGAFARGCSRSAGDCLRSGGDCLRSLEDCLRSAGVAFIRPGLLSFGWRGRRVDGPTRVVEAVRCGVRARAPDRLPHASQIPPVTCAPNFCGGVVFEGCASTKPQVTTLAHPSKSMPPQKFGAGVISGSRSVRRRAGYRRQCRQRRRRRQRRRHRRRHRQRRRRRPARRQTLRPRGRCFPSCFPTTSLPQPE